MDSLKLLDDEIKKIDIEKLLYAFYKESYEDNIQSWYTLRRELEDELKRTKGKLNKEFIQEELKDVEELYAKAPKPEDLKMTQELIKTIRDYITDQVLIILTDICENILQGEYKPYLWKDSPDMKIRKGGAVFVHFKAKAKFLEIIDDLAETIARQAGRFMPKSRIVTQDHIERASKIITEKKIELDNLRKIIKEEIERAMSREYWSKRSGGIEPLKKILATTETKAIDIAEIKREILETAEDELVKEMIEFVKQEREQRYFYRETIDILDDFLVRKFLIKKFGPITRYEFAELLEDDEQVRTKMDRVTSVVRDRLNEEKRRSLAKQKEILPKLVNECVEWVKMLGIRSSFKKEHVRTFLIEKNIELSPTMVDALYDSVRTKLQKRSSGGF